MKKLNKNELIHKIEILENRLEDINKRVFNKYSFIENLEDFLKNEIETNNCKNEDVLYTLIGERIANECIYYFDCFEIIKTLNIKNWEDYIKSYGEIYSIDKLAYIALEELINEELNTINLIKMIELKQNK